MRYLLTSALPYANGPLHFGHLVGVQLPADIYKRHLQSQGHEVFHVCGSDEHGVAITMSAKKEKADYQEYVNKWNREHQELFRLFEIEFDCYGQTSSAYHHQESKKWFLELYNKKLIETKVEKQLFCESCQSNLADRYIEGTCYNCSYPKARGDECPDCGEWIDSIKLINPTCKMCSSNQVVTKDVTQFYLMLSRFQKEYGEWFSKIKTNWRKTVSTQVEGITKDGLIDRAISRDLDWGVDIPIEGFKDKKMYVWFDAPIGYVSFTKQFFEETSGKNKDEWKDWWQSKDTTIVNFLGKDNVIFHGIIFPIMSMASNQVNPVTEVLASQFLNLEGKQFSKSEGHYIDSFQAMDAFGSIALRYYLISILPEMSDSSFSWDQFISKVNNELANNIGNFINRALKFLEKNFPDGLTSANFKNVSSDVKAFISVNVKETNHLLDQKQFKLGLENVMALGQKANQHFSEVAPWALIKTDREKTADVLAESVLFSYFIGRTIYPFLPSLSKNILDFFGHVNEGIKEEESKALYQGKLEHLSKLFNSGFKVEKPPTALVPKIDKVLVETFKNKLAK